MTLDEFRDASDDWMRLFGNEYGTRRRDFAQTPEEWERDFDQWRQRRGNSLRATYEAAILLDGPQARGALGE